MSSLVSSLLKSGHPVCAGRARGPGSTPSVALSWLVTAHRRDRATLGHVRTQRKHSGLSCFIPLSGALSREAKP